MELFVYFLDKSVSFEKSVSFSDEPPDMNSPKQHSPQHAGKNLMFVLGLVPFRFENVRKKRPKLSHIKL